MLLALFSVASAGDPPPKLAFDTAAAVTSAGKTFDQGPAHVEFGDGVFVPIPRRGGRGRLLRRGNPFGDIRGRPRSAR